MGDEQLFGRVADMRRIVDHQRPGMDMFQQVRGRDVGHVERRILAHQDDVDVGEVDHLFRPQGKVIALPPAHLERARPGAEAAVAKHQVVGLIVVETVAPASCLEGEGERRVGVDVDRFDRVHLDGDG